MYFSRSVSPLRNTFGLFGLFEWLLGRCCGLLWLLLGDTLRLNIAILAAASIFAAFKAELIRLCSEELLFVSSKNA